MSPRITAALKALPVVESSQPGVQTGMAMSRAASSQLDSGSL
jgi:hypothetical protein